jgi:UDP-N-acetylglucosamine diphosphorylase/glucosamine-1-phosphate N-acetyltransferase
LLPDAALVKAISALGMQQMLVKDGRVLALRAASGIEKFEILSLQASGFQAITYTAELRIIQYPEDIFRRNGVEIKADFEVITRGRISAGCDDTNRLIAPDQIFIEAGAKLCCATINASAGPVYIAADAEIMEGATIKGPFFLGEHSTIKMGAKIYGDTSVGPHCKVGGEVSNSVILGYSNKGHDGFMGNSVIGEWCNWGADTNNSNLKNNYEIVKLWDHVTGRFRSTGLQFAGLMMADHAKTGINTMFNTGTVVGVGANIFGAGFPRNFLPSFAWGGAQGIETFRFNKFVQTAEKVMERRGIALDEVEMAILQAVYEETAVQRTWEK